MTLANRTTASFFVLFLRSLRTSSAPHMQTGLLNTIPTI